MLVIFSGFESTVGLYIVMHGSEINLLGLNFGYFKLLQPPVVTPVCFVFWLVCN